MPRRWRPTVPTLASWLAEGSHVLTDWHCDCPVDVTVVGGRRRGPNRADVTRDGRPAGRSTSPGTRPLRRVVHTRPATGSAEFD